jgi:hypothetical protein
LTATKRPFDLVVRIQAIRESADFVRARVDARPLQLRRGIHDKAILVNLIVVSHGGTDFGLYLNN